MFPSIKSFGTVMSKKTVFYNDPMKSTETYFKTVKEDNLNVFSAHSIIN